MKKLRNTPKLIEKVAMEEADAGVYAKVEEREMERAASEEEPLMVKE
jgi:hypothetical protein